MSTTRHSLQPSEEPPATLHDAIQPAGWRCSRLRVSTVHSEFLRPTDAATSPGNFGRTGTTTFVAESCGGPTNNGVPELEITPLGYAVSAWCGVRARWTPGPGDPGCSVRVCPGSGFRTVRSFVPPFVPPQPQWRHRCGAVTFPSRRRHRSSLAGRTTLPLRVTRLRACGPRRIRAARASDRARSATRRANPLAFRIGTTRRPSLFRHGGDMGLSPRTATRNEAVTPATGDPQKGPLGFLVARTGRCLRPPLTPRRRRRPESRQDVRQWATRSACTSQAS